MEKDNGYWITFKEYHQHDVWGRFLEWLEKITKRRRKNEQKNRRKK